MKARAIVLAVALIVVSWAQCGPGVAPWGGAGTACAQDRPPVPPPATTFSEDTPTLEEVLDLFVEAVGGAEAVQRLETRVVRARIVTDLPTWDPPVYEVDSLTVYSKASGKYLTVQQTSGGTVFEGCDGADSWKRDVKGEISAFHPIDARSAWLVDPQFPIRLREYFPEMVLLGTATLDGRSVHVVEVDDDHSHRLYFDAESHLLVRLGYNRIARDHREVDGVMVPFEVEYSRKGGSSTFVLDSVVHNGHIDDELFARPE